MHCFLIFHPQIIFLQADKGRIMYTNSIRAYTSSYGEITRQSHFMLNVNCQMEQDSVSQILYVAREIENTTITGTGRYNTSMAFYTSSNFYHQVCSGGKGSPTEKILIMLTFFAFTLR